MQLKIEYLKIEDITPYKNNAKIHTAEQIKQIKNSIKEFGMNDPIGIWGEKNIIVEGHGRLIACEQLDRKCYGMELEPKYVDVIINRWEQFTGDKAVLLNVETAESE